MIEVIEGNILMAEEQIITHQVNCQGVMGAGLAAQIRKKYPIVYERYVSLVQSRKDNKEVLGKTQIIKVESDKFIANIFGQYTYGRLGIHTSYTALESALTDLKLRAQKHKKAIALPHGIGCGLAGGDWSKVSSIIENVFSDYKVALYKFK
ncbi:Appr-1-p processing protein [Rossellomorea marisflavi]|nr:Appr-1-p processing protein [Rossellomorea marisflavi]